MVVDVEDGAFVAGDKTDFGLLAGSLVWDDGEGSSASNVPDHGEVLGATLDHVAVPGGSGHFGANILLVNLGFGSENVSVFGCSDKSFHFFIFVF